MDDPKGNPKNVIQLRCRKLRAAVKNGNQTLAQVFQDDSGNDWSAKAERTRMMEEIKSHIAAALAALRTMEGLLNQYAGMDQVPCSDCGKPIEPERLPLLGSRADGLCLCASCAHKREAEDKKIAARRKRR